MNALKLTYTLADLPEKRAHAAQWTAIVPAAGQGSRLNFSGPKITYPILGKPMLHWMVRLLSPLCRDVVMVVSETGVPLIQPSLKTELGQRGRIAIQKQPTGMADAIRATDGMVHTPYVMVIWGDQITANRHSLEACMGLLESTPALQATMPTMIKDDPYIHFFRDPQGRIHQVYERREADEPMPRGESDCGVFMFRTDKLFEVLQKTENNAAYRGSKTKENNFLSLIPLFDQGPGALAVIRIDDFTETIGVNTPEQAILVSRILKQRYGL